MERFPLLFVICAAAALAAVVLVVERVALSPPSPEVHAPPAARHGAPGEAPPAGAADPAAVPAGSKGRAVAVLIDDIGFDLGIVEQLARIPLPLAFAVLPHTPFAAPAAGVLHAAGKEILLHLPMEPHPNRSAASEAGTLRIDMDGESIRRQVREALASVPHAAGVNNHQGSRFMEDEDRLAIVMEELAKRGLYFVDSMTTPRSRGISAARRAGVRFAARDRFIDHHPGYAAAYETLSGAAGREDGTPLLLIGHPHPETVRALRDAIPRWERDGVRIVALPTLLRQAGPQGRLHGDTGHPPSPRKETPR